MPFRTTKTDIWQYDIQVAGRRFRGSCGTKDYEAAKAIEASIRANAKTPKASGHTLSEALGTYYRDVAQDQPSARVTASQSRELLRIMDGKMQIAKITNAHVLGFAAKKRATCANATVNRHLQLLGRALRHMARFYDATVPDLELRAAQAKEPKERIRELSFDEQSRLFECLPTDMHPPVKFALLTGARVGTICDLRWSDIDTEGCNMLFRLKGDSAMTFPMGREVAAILSALPRSNVQAHRALVFTRLDQQTLERVRIVPHGGVFHAAWRKALANADIEDFRFHDLRHTFATRMLRQSRNIKLVSKLLGHTSIETTSRYAHVLVDDMRSAIDDFSALSGGVPQKNPQTMRGSTRQAIEKKG